MQVVNAALRYTGESFKRSGVCVKKHFVAFPGVGFQPEGAAGAQLGVCQLDATHAHRDRLGQKSRSSYHW
jgi:hypothetical protein